MEYLEMFKGIAHLFKPYSLYFLGFTTFTISVIEDLFDSNKRQKFTYYLIEFMYTTLSILVGIWVCNGLDCSKATTTIISVLMGLTGSNIIKKIKANKERISDKAVDRVIESVENFGKDSKPEEIPVEEGGLIYVDNIALSTENENQ